MGLKIENIGKIQNPVPFEKNQTVLSPQDCAGTKGHHSYNVPKKRSKKGDSAERGDKTSIGGEVGKEKL